MAEHIQTLVNALNEVAETNLVWPRGLLHPGGPHRKLVGYRFPLSIGEDECLLFGRLIKTFRPEHCFIVGNAFGLSSCYIAHAMSHHGGKSVITLDNQQEGQGKLCAGIAQKLTDRMGLSLLKNKKGTSPKDLPDAVEQDIYHLIFIDGLHWHPQVTRDFEGLLPYSDDRTLFVWHDYHLLGVHQSVEAATGHGLRCLWVPTSCEMVVGTRDNATFEKLQSMFARGVENPRAHNIIVGAAPLIPEFLRRRLEPLWTVGSRANDTSSRR